MTSSLKSKTIKLTPDELRLIKEAIDSLESTTQKLLQKESDKDVPNIDMAKYLTNKGIALNLLYQSL